MPSLKDFIAESKKRGYSKEEIAPELLKKGYSQKEITLAFEGQNNSPNFKNEGADLQSRKTLSFFEKIGKVFTPSFFQEVREHSILPSFLMFLSVGIVILILSFLFGLLMRSFQAPSYGLGTSYFFFFSSSFFSISIFIIGIASTFIYSGISHFIVYLFKGQGKFTDSYNAITYSLVPFVILSIIPFIGMFSFIYSLILSTYGLSEYHKISKGKAFTAAFIPILIVLIILIAIVILYLSFLRASI